MQTPSDIASTLTAKGLGLHGPTWRGWAWYRREANAAALAAAGQSGRYKPAEAALSGFYRSAEEAGRAGLAEAQY